MKIRCVSSFLIGAAVALLLPAVTAASGSLLQKVLRRCRRLRSERGIRERKHAILQGRLVALQQYATSGIDVPGQGGTGAAADEVARLTGGSIVSIRRSVTSGAVPCRRVVKAFILMALAAHARTNCIVDVLTPEEVELQIQRLEWILQLRRDQQHKRRNGQEDCREKEETGRSISDSQSSSAPKPHRTADEEEEDEDEMLLFGVPVSVKDNISLTGLDCTLALHSRCFAPSTADSAVVDRLRSHGAILFCKTNVPVLLLSYETDSALFGPCRNPVDGRFSAGGSSGGEAALVALKGCAGGVGSDIGGSIRGPAAFCGVAALKPSMFRVANNGTYSVLPAQEGVGATIGPLAKTVADVTVLTRALFPPPFSRTSASGHHVSAGDDSHAPGDAVGSTRRGERDGSLRIPLEVPDGVVNNVPFRLELYRAGLAKPQLRFGYYDDDGFIKSSPACARAVRVAKEALEAAGHLCVAIDVAAFAHTALAHFYQVLSADGATTILRGLGDEHPIGPVFHALRFATFSPLQKFVYGTGVRLRMRSPFFGAMLQSMTERSMAAYYTLMLARNDLRHAFAARIFGDLGLDAVLCPGMMVPAVRLGGSANVAFAITYTMLFNVLDLPAVSVPVTTVDAALDRWDDGFAPLGGHEGPLHRLVREEYCAACMHGLPVGVQVATPRFSEELTLAFAERLETLLLK